MMFSRIRTIGLLFSCLFLAPLTLRGAGDGIPVPTDAPAPVPDANALLGQEFKDETNGFKVQVPFGVRIFQRAGLELMSFVHDSKQWAGNVELQPLEKDMTPAELLRSRAGSLEANFKAVQAIDSHETVVSGKPAGIMISSLEKQYAVEVDAKGKPVKFQTLPLIRLEMMVQMASNQYMVMTFFAPLGQKDDAIAVFNAMVGSFELLDRKAIEERRLTAAKVGRDWLAKIKAEDLINRIVREPQMFRIKIENRDVGYLRLDEAADVTTDGFRGISVMANSRTFPDSGTEILGSNESFWAYHDQGPKLGELPSYSTWDDRSGTAVPTDPNRVAVAQPKVQDIKPGQIIRGVAELPPEGIVKWSEEIGTLQMQMHPQVNNNQQINMAPQYDLTIILMAEAQDIFNPAHNKPLQWTINADQPAPLPKPLEYVWPRLVDLTKESQMALVVFNPRSGQNKLGLRFLTVGKQETITIDSEAVRVTRLTDELGNESRTLWVDAKGTIMMMRTSDGSVLLPTTEEKMAQLWSAKLAKFK